VRIFLTCELSGREYENENKTKKVSCEEKVRLYVREKRELRTREENILLSKCKYKNCY